jgi:hypothetical protein
MSLRRRSLLARMRPTVRANRCPQLEVERTQRGRHPWAVHDPDRTFATETTGIGSANSTEPQAALLTGSRPTPRVARP